MVGGEFTGYYRFLKGFYGLADMPPAFQQHIDKTLKHETPAWLDDISIVTRGTTDEHHCLYGRENNEKIRRQLDIERVKRKPQFSRKK